MAAPATVGGEFPRHNATGKPGRRREAKNRKPGDLPSNDIANQRDGGFRRDGKTVAVKILSFDRNGELNHDHPNHPTHAGPEFISGFVPAGAGFFRPSVRRVPGFRYRFCPFVVDS